MNDNNEKVIKKQEETIKKFEDRTNKCLKTLLIKTMDNTKKK